MASKISPQDYVFRFGKHNGFKAVDVAEMYKVNPKTGADEAVGLKYLHFLVEKCEWFRDTEIIKKVIEIAESNMSDKDPEPEPTPKKKKEKKGCVNIESNPVVNF